MTATLGFELRRVSKAYGRHRVLTDCDLVLPPLQHTTLLGSSACGKSTVLRLVAGLELPTSGEVLMGATVASQAGRVIVPPHRRGISMVFQDLGLWPSLNVLDNVRVALDGLSVSSAERTSRALGALEMCRVDDVRDRLPGTLSGGQQQRVALARAVAGDPSFLLLDEPFAGLDLATKGTLLDDIKRLASTRGLTLLLVTHDPIEALALCEHAAVVEDGHVTQHGPWTELLRNPQSGLLRAFRSTYERYQIDSIDDLAASAITPRAEK